MYSTCLRCDRSLGTNEELAHLGVGRRIAFDGTHGRLWVICPRCGQWNLVPLEERWEALEECERVAKNAEARGAGAGLGLALTEGGLELLQVGGFTSTDIANWRYGRRLEHRQSILLWIGGALVLLGMALGVRAGLEMQSPGLGIYIALLAAIWFGFAWYRPPRLWLSLPHFPTVGRILWPWQLQDIRVELAENNRPTVVVPRGRQRVALRETQAAQFLAAILPKLNGADCAAVSVSDALERVAKAEEATQKRPKARRRRNGHNRRAHGGRDAPQLAPWEILASELTGMPLTQMEPERRVALEMAVTEDCERADVVRRAGEFTEAWREEDEVAAIADDLLLPPEVEARLAAEKARLGELAAKPTIRREE